MPTRNISLTDALDGLIEEEVRSGRFQNASEVVRAGLRLFERQKREDAARLAALHEALDVALKQAERGEAREIEDIDRYVDEAVERIEAEEDAAATAGRG